MVTSEQLAEWERLANAATEGPWTQDSRVNFVRTDCSDERIAGCFIVNCLDPARSFDAEFIAAARTAVPALIDEVRKLRMFVEVMRPTLAEAGIV